MAICRAKASRLLPRLVQLIGKEARNADCTLHRFVLLCELYGEMAGAVRSSPPMPYDETRQDILIELELESVGL